MQKDLQKILILGIVSIIISAIALYSFKDIKFKNTKKLTEQTQKQQEIIQEYQELVNNPSEIFLVETNNSLATTWTLKIFMPKFLFNTGFADIDHRLKEKDIILNFEHIGNFSSYKELIQSGLNNSDIYLLPSNRLAWLELETINIWENPKVYFHNIFNNLVTIDQNKFIPYSIDPIITLTKTNLNISSSRKDIFTHTTLRKQDRKYTMPLIRWIWKNDIRLLERLSWPFENYFDILYIHLKQIKKNNDVSELKNMLDTEKISLDYKYNFATFKQLYETIEKRNSDCILFPAICLMSYNFGDIKFWFLSDLDILETYFSSNKNLFKINEFPNSKSSYPAKWWVFVVAKWNENINLANEFFVEYIRQWVENNTWLRNNTLSAINSIYYIQKTQEKYSEIIQHENNFELIYESINLQEEFIKNSKNLDLLKWNHNPDLYLKH